ncbi:MAG: hypothetical protein ABSD21_04015 [Rhizomicrobium sp.]|jgi:hypothetical protein
MDVGVILGIIGIVISVLALGLGLMALPTVFQMFFGRPDFDFGVDEFTGPDGKSLFITLRNKTTKSWFLKKIGVVRETGDIDASFNIRQLGTNQPVATLVSGSLHNAALRESGLMVRAFPGRTIGLTVIHMYDDTAHIVDARRDDLETIAPGDYIVDAAFICSERIFRVSKNLRVGEAPHLTFWY